MKRQILFCLLIVSGNALLADDVPTTSPMTGQPNQLAQATVPIPTAVLQSPLTATSGAVPPSAEPLTAPPMVVSPNGAALPPPITSQYQPGMVAPPGSCPTCGGAPQYGMPMGRPDGNADGAADGNGPAGRPCCAGNDAVRFSVQRTDARRDDGSDHDGRSLAGAHGWVQRYEFGVMPFSQVKDGADRFGEWAFDLGWKYVAPLYPIPATFSFEQQYDLRLLTGPSSAPGTYPSNLPGSLNRIGWDFELKTTAPGPLNVVVAFNPSIDSDFQKSLTSDGFNWDGRAAFLYSPNRELTYVLGAVFWDRLHERVLPWAGVIYRPEPDLPIRFDLPAGAGEHVSLGRVGFQDDALRPPRVSLGSLSNLQPGRRRAGSRRARPIGGP